MIEALAEKGILQEVDYLSTVSGGGYIGSTLSTVLNVPGIDSTNNFPFCHTWGQPESQAFKHLRNHSNYLTPRGLVDRIRLAALLLRGTVINLTLIAPYVAFLACFTVWWFDSQFHEQSTARWRPQQPFLLTSVLVVVLAAWLLVSPWVQRYRLWSLFVGTVSLLWRRVRRVLLRKQALEEDSLPTSRLARRSLFEYTFGVLLAATAGLAVWESQPFAVQFAQQLVHNRGETQTGEAGFPVWLGSLLTIIAALIPFLLARRASLTTSRFTSKLILVALGLLGPLILWIIYLTLCSWILSDDPFPDSLRNSKWLPAWLHDVSTLWLILASSLALWVLGFLTVDVNRTSLHSFYRDRLSRAFLFYSDQQGNPIQDRDFKGLRPPDELKLSELNQPEATAPYHLVNATLNLQGSRDPELRHRQADFFFLSKHFIGSWTTGFCRTKEIENMDPNLNLGTAMAISGAAASPNMGTSTIRPLVLILGMLNVRLGYWLPNPQFIRRASISVGTRIARLAVATVGPLYFMRELFGRLSKSSRMINLSDGGHIENLGVYELLRRRCKFIIACDAEADANMRFGSLAKLIRYARIDHAFDLDIDLGKLRPNERGLSARHCSLGRIEYRRGQTGYLLYIKASVSGDEGETTKEYGARHPKFPHEPTTDQFFTEEQFEAYRHLGWHIAERLTRESRKAQSKKKASSAVERLFQGVPSKYRPRA